MLALGEDGPFESLDVPDADPEQLGDVLGRHPGTDVRLDVAGVGAGESGFGVALQAAQLGAQRLVDGEREAVAGVGREHEATVLGADHFELFHADVLQIQRVRPWCHGGRPATGISGACREFAVRPLRKAAATRRPICDSRVRDANYGRPNGPHPLQHPES